MKVQTATVNKKDTLRVYLAQCAFFGFSPKDEFTLDKMSAHEVYAQCEHDFKNQPKRLQRKYMKLLGIIKQSWWDRLTRMGVKK